MLECRRCLRRNAGARIGAARQRSRDRMGAPGVVRGRCRPPPEIGIDRAGRASPRIARCIECCIPVGPFEANRRFAETPAPESVRLANGHAIEWARPGLFEVDAARHRKSALIAALRHALRDASKCCIPVGPFSESTAKTICWSSSTARRAAARQAIAARAKKGRCTCWAARRPCRAPLSRCRFKAASTPFRSTPTVARNRPGDRVARRPGRHRHPVGFLARGGATHRVYRS